MGHSSSSSEGDSDYKHLKHKEKRERKHRKRMLKHGRHSPSLLPIGHHGHAESGHHGLLHSLTDGGHHGRPEYGQHSPSLLPIGYHGHAESSHHGLLHSLTDHHGGHPDPCRPEHGHHSPSLLPIGHYGHAESSHHGLLHSLTSHHGRHHGRPGLVTSLIGGVTAALAGQTLAGGRNRDLPATSQHSVPPPTDYPPMSYNNNRPGFPEPGQYAAPGYPPPDHVGGLGSFSDPNCVLTDQGPRSFPESGYPSLDQGQGRGQKLYPATAYADDQFVPYGQGRSAEMSTKSSATIEPPQDYKASAATGYGDNQFVPYGQGRSAEKPTESSATNGPPQDYKAPPGPPPAYSAKPQSAPPSGFRVPLNTTSSFFPPPSELGPPQCFDLDRSPLYFGSAIFPRSVHPCKVGTHLEAHALVAYGGKEQPHSGRYDLLPFSPETMELVRTSRGQIPPGRRPVEGGYEENGAKLYHAVATVSGVRVPGKTGQHLGGANVGFGGEEIVVTDNYDIICWK